MAKRNKEEDSMAVPQQKATPVEPPDVRQVASPVSFFNDPRMAQKNAGVKDFSPQRVHEDAAGNGESPSPEADG